MGDGGEKFLVDIFGNLGHNIFSTINHMKFFLFIIFSAVALTLFGIISHSERSAQEAKRYREQRRMELSSSKYDNSDFWPNSTANMIVTYPKKTTI